MRLSLACCSTILMTFFALTADLPRAEAQFVEAKPTKGPKLDKSLTEKYKVGITVVAQGGPCKGILGTLPVPTEWPEQQVKIVNEDISPSVKKVEYRMLGGLAKQMVVQIPQLSPGEEAHAVVTFQITRNSILPPDDTTIFQLPDPKKLDHDLQIFLGASPYIETLDPKIRDAAKEAIGDKETAWEKVESIYDWTRSKIKYEAGPLKGASKALAEGTGDCEELSSLFIALCRVNHIPARIVWVPGHCYPEFYLVDGDGVGYWIPCQAAGSRQFGGVTEHRPILQKGDNFKDPDRPKEKLRYVNEFLKGLSVKGGGKPQVEFIKDELPN